MDYTSSEPPPIPTRSRHLDNSRRKSLPGSSGAAGGTSGTKTRNLAPANPEVISNLITSLSVISRPSSNYFDAPPGASSLSMPNSPGLGGSFGVDYGAYLHPGADQAGERNPSDLDELPASSPVIRTAKPPSGFSPLTAPPKSPRTPRSSSRDNGGLRSLLRSSGGHSGSRPSSPGSLASKNDDVQSIGNLSIERGSAPTPELKHRNSHDSWGKKAARSSKGLMYMSSRERLREKDHEHKRNSLGASGSGSGVASSSHSGGRADPFLAETAISEEPGTNSDRAMDSPRPIPARDSSLRVKSSSTSKRSSARRSKRDSDGALGEAIREGEATTSKRHSKKKVENLDLNAGLGANSNPSDYATPIRAPSATRQVRESSSHVQEHGLVSPPEEAEEDGAPFPAVSQGRRRGDRSTERSSKRKSGRQSPGPSEAVRIKRSSSRLKRLSDQLSPHAEDEGPDRGASAEFNPLPAAYDRPASADSVDDAVESYLCSPRLSQKIKHPQTGRVISFSEVGDSEGSAVFCCVGMGLTRYITAFYDELALTLKLRLITPDRPGVGDSEPYSDGTATPLSWPDDVYAICQALKITKFSILAHSAGAIYALATALRMPQHIRGRIHLLAPWIPPSQMSVFGASQTPPTNAIPTSQRILRALPTPILKAANSSFMTATSSSITSSLPKTPKRGKRKSNAQSREANNGTRNANPSLDKENIALSDQNKPRETMARNVSNGDGPRTDGTRANNDRNTDRKGDSEVLNAAADAVMDKERQMTYDMRLSHAIWELATTGANPAVDLLVCLERRHTIGFRYVDITRPVVVHHGSRDTRVPVDNVRWLGKTMRRCEVRVLEGEGHGLMASAGVMGAVLMEMSKEWEDWMRVTGADGRKERERGRRGTFTTR